MVPIGRSFAPILGFAVACAVGACAPRPSFPLGTDCELATQCAAPLVCRLGRCRDECRSNRDCRAGLYCVRADGLGACLLETETCALSSECPMTLVCLNGTCANACEDDVDCPAGARCIVDLEHGGARGCRDLREMGCSYNSQCGDGLICAADGRCREECRGPRDCRDGTVCDMATFTCVWPSADGSVDSGLDSSGLDAGPTDAAMLDAAMLDAAMLDAAMADAGVTTGPAPAPVMAGGDRHTCALFAGSLRCWGANTTGQLGDGTILDHAVPAPVLTLAAASTTLVTTGVSHTCAVDATGLYCWGNNASGQVGDGTGVSTRPSPTLIAGAATTSIASGRDHTCAVRGGIVECWGDNTLGQLGDGTITPHRAPTPTLALLAAPREVAARGRETCALLTDGRVQCWGENVDGQLGNGTSSAGATSSPQLVVGLTDAVEVEVGATHACARRVDGEVVCWGSNDLGALGDGSPSAPTHYVRETPGPVPGLGTAVEIGAGLDHVCARLLDGRVFCWGGNTFGQVGVNNLVPMPWVTTPREVLGVSATTEIAAGDSHTCARVAAGLRCWGANLRGQLGDGTSTESFAPVSVMWP